MKKITKSRKELVTATLLRRWKAEKFIETRQHFGAKGGMRMYKCKDCYNEFDEPKVIHDAIGEYHGQIAYQDWYVCPYCESDDYEELEEEEL